MVNFFRKLPIDSDLMVLATGRVIQTILSLIALRVITSVLSVEEVGNYYLLLAFGFFFSYILLNPIAMYFSRQLIEWAANGTVLFAYRLFCGAVAIAAFISLVISSLLYFFLEYEEKFGFLEFTIVMLGIVSLSVLHRNTLTGINILLSRTRFILYMIATLAIGLVLASTYAFYFQAEAVYWFYGLLTAEILTFPFVYRYFSSRFVLGKGLWRKDESFRPLKIAEFCMPIFGTNIFLWCQLYLYRIIVDERYGEEILGIIGVAIAIAAAAFAAIENIISQYFYPIYIKKIHNVTKLERAIAWNNMASQVIPIYMLLAVFLLATAKSLVIVLANEKFHDAYVFTMLAVGAEFFRVMTNLFNYILHAEYKTKLALLPYFLGVIFIVSCLIIFDFKDALEGIGWTLLLGNGIIFICLFHNVHKVIQIQAKLNLGKLVLLSIPFLVYFGIPKPDYMLIENVIILAIFGLYFLFAVYLINLDSRKIFT